MAANNYNLNPPAYLFALFLLDPETLLYLDYDSEQAYFAGPSDATHAMAAMLLRHCAIAARTGPPPNPAALWAGQTLHEI